MQAYVSIYGYNSYVALKADYAKIKKAVCGYMNFNSSVCQSGYIFFY